MRVLLVRGVSTGGIGIHVRSLADGLRQSGHQAAIFQATGVRGLLGIRKQAVTADVVHAHGIRAGAAACVALGVLGGKSRRRQRLIVTLHNAPLPGNGTRARVRRALSGLLERIIARRADTVLGASSDLVARAERYGAADARFAPVAAPPTRPPTRSRADVRAEFGLAPDDPRPIVLAVGRLAPQKDYATLLDAVNILDDRDPLPLILIAGDGPLREALQVRIFTENLPALLLGHRSDVPDLLAAADAYILSSTWEARPLALQEAMRVGTPTVATNVGGIPGLVGDACLLSPPSDPQGLATVLARLLDSPGLRADLGRAAGVRARAWPRREEELEAVLDAYRGGHRGGRRPGS